jgi:hypothetical protein
MAPRAQAESRGKTALNFIVFMLALLIGAAPAAAVEQCRFIQAKPEREACYARQEIELEAKRKPETTNASRDSKTIESLQQMRQDDEAVYRSIHGICRGC